MSFKRKEGGLKMSYKARVGLILLSLVFICVKSASAQQVPGAAKSGAVQKSLEVEKVPEKAEKKASPFQSLGYPKEGIEIPEGKKFLLKGFDIQGNTVLKTPYLKTLISKYLNQELSLKDLRNACDIIQDAYNKRGYFLAMAVLPEQEIAGGVVKIQIIEGRLGEVRIEKGKFYKERFIRSHFRPAKYGIVNYHALLKSLLLLNENSDLDLKAVLEKGKELYTVDIVLKAEDKLPLHFSAEYNNFGTRYISRPRSALEAQYTNLALDGDKITLRGVTGSPARTLGYARGEYSIPLNGYGTRAGLSYTWCQFDVQREFRQLDSGGNSRIYGFYVTHPLNRTLTSSSDLNFGFDYKQFKDFLLGTMTSNDELRVFSAGFSGDFMDKFKGRNYYSFLISCGVDGIMGGSRHDDPMASRQGAGGEFVKGNFSLARFQKLLWDNYALVKVSSQVASDTLPIAEQLAIGGADTVRGFPQSERLGDYGTVANFELRSSPPFIGDMVVPFIKRKIKNFIQLVGFIDYGVVHLKHQLPGENKFYELTGAGYGARLDFGHDFTFRVDVGYPVSGKQSSGDHTAVYVQAMKKF